MAIIVKGNDGNPNEVTVTSGSDGYRLGTDANVHIVGGIVALTGSMKWEKRTTDLSISDSTFTTFWEKSETGALYGAVFKLDDEDMIFRVELDGEVILECELKDELKDEFKLNHGAGHSHGNNFSEGPPFLFMYNTKHYRFYPPEPVRFNSTMKLQLKANKSNKDLEAYLVTWRSA